jgi:hypothetical protein
MFWLSKLLKEHEELLAASRDLVDELERSNDYEEGKFGRLRARIGVLLKDHLTSENEDLISKLTPDLRSQIAGYDRVIRSTQELRFAYSAHTRLWTSATAASDMQGYKRATKKLVEQLKLHVELEETQLYHPAVKVREAAGCDTSDTTHSSVNTAGTIPQRLPRSSATAHLNLKTDAHSQRSLARPLR